MKINKTTATKYFNLLPMLYIKLKDNTKTLKKEIRFLGTNNFEKYQLNVSYV